MKATCWMGANHVEVQEVPEPKILNPRDAIVRITSTAICGSDLHLYDGYMPTMEKGDILGHEFMGEVVEVGPGAASTVAVGDRVVVPFTISCGACLACQRGLYSLCENTNPNAAMAEKAFGFPTADLRVLAPDRGLRRGPSRVRPGLLRCVGPLKIESGLSDEQVLFLSDIFPTGYMGAEMCDIKPAQVVAVWGAGPVGQFAMASALVLGAEKVIAIDRVPSRLEMARTYSGAEVVN